MPKLDISRALAFMCVSAFAVFFIYTSKAQLENIEERTAKVVTSLAPETLQKVAKRDPKLAALFELESNVIRQRYALVSAGLLTRTWMSYLGFLSGVTVTLIGAFFVVAKLREPKIESDVSLPSAKIKIASASPGLILSVLGVVLIALSIPAHRELNIRTERLFLPEFSSPNAKSAQNATTIDPNETVDDVMDDIINDVRDPVVPGSGASPSIKERSVSGDE